MARTLAWLLVLATGCGGADDAATDAGADSGGGDDAGPDAGDDAGSGPACDAPVEPPCVDEMIVDLSLHADLVSEGEVTTTTDGGDFVTRVDATAGGFGYSSESPWVYLRFEPEGARRIDIDDETALESTEWHMALRRFIVRLNGGDSGPSCVGAASFLERSYEDLTEVPEGIEWGLDDYYTADCSFVNDSSGLEGSPQVILSPWWEYGGCVATTGVPHLLRLEDGSVVALVVEEYYEDPEDQAACNETDEAPADAVSAVFTLRWRFLP